MALSSWRRLLGTGAAVLVLSAGLSHLVAAALGVAYASVGRLSVQPDRRGPPIAVLGSSLTLYGLDHEALATALGRPVTALFVPSGSPAELETLQAEVAAASTTVVGVSIYDMNELVLADRRPELVPLGRAMADLWETGADWPFAKRVLGQYVLHATARAFPTAGKSDLVMVGIRRVARDLAGRRSSVRSVAAPPLDGAVAPPAVAFDPRAVPDRERTLEEWPLEERLRSVANYRASGREQHAFRGPKSLALRRLASATAARGEVVVVVFPVSLTYAREFLDAAATARLEQELDSLARAVPAVAVLRLDRDPALRSDRAFRDLVHLGSDGRRRATEALAALLLGR